MAKRSIFHPDGHIAKYPKAINKGEIDSYRPFIYLRHGNLGFTFWTVRGIKLPIGRDVKSTNNRVVRKFIWRLCDGLAICQFYRGFGRFVSGV